MKEDEFDPLGWKMISRTYAQRESLSYDDFAIPSLPALLNLAGIKSIKGPNNVSIRWSCCGLYEVSVNSGELESEIPMKPGNFSTDIRPSHSWNPEGLREGHINPFSWDLKSPVPFYDESGRLLGIAVMEGTRWSGVKVSEVLRADFKEYLQECRPDENLNINGIKLLGNVLACKASSNVRVYSIDSEPLFLSRDSHLAFVPGNQDLVIATGRYDIKVSTLYPFTYFKNIYRPGDVIESNSLVLKLSKPLFISSLGPIKVTLDRGKAEVMVRGPTYVGEGSEPQALRALLQLDSWFLAWPQGKLGFVTANASSAMIYNVSLKNAKIVALNPTPFDAQIDIKLNQEVEGGTICTPLGCYPIERSPQGIVRVPAPKGCYCELSIETRLKPSLGLA